MSESERWATITPKPDSAVCGATGCDETQLLAYVNPDNSANARTLCPRHRVEYLREVSNR